MSNFKDQFKPKGEYDETQGIFLKKFEYGPNYGQKLECIREDSESGRTYLVPGGFRYPSVTTILGATKSESASRALKNWQNRLGMEKAEGIKNNSANLGKTLHKQCELLVDNKGDSSFMENPLFVQLIPFLKRLGRIELNESTLYSHKLRAAGTTDNIAYFDGKRSVVDYKNSLRYKDDWMIEDYWVQTLAYGIMYQELYKTKIEQLVIMIAVNGKPKGQLFVKDIKDCTHYVKLLHSKVVQYHSETK